MIQKNIKHQGKKERREKKKWLKPEITSLNYNKTNGGIGGGEPEGPMYPENS